MTIRARASGGRVRESCSGPQPLGSPRELTVLSRPPMDEYELEQVKREIVESRGLTIKTNNLVNALAADLKSISKRQQGSERRVLVTSATGYVVTIAIILVFVKLAWDIR